MTYREKLKIDHPEYINPEYDGGCKGCPHEYGYTDSAACRSSIYISCTDCWDREIPETDISNNEKENETMPVTVPVQKMTKAQMLEEIERASVRIHEMETELKNLEKYKELRDCCDEIKAMHTALMDSGFTNDQAFDLLKTTMQSMMPTILRGMRL